MKVLQTSGLVSVVVLVLAISSADATVDNVITQWNAVAQQLSRTRGIPSQVSARLYALVHVAQYKALQLAYLKKANHPEAAAAYAAHYILSVIDPSRQSPVFDGALAKQILPLKLSKKEDASLRKIALSYSIPLAKKRVFDGSQSWAQFQPAPLGSPAGKYQFTPNQTFALYPQLGSTTPFIIKSPKLFDHFGGPPKIPSAEYDANYKISAQVGDSSSPSQSQAQKNTAKFWEDGSTTSEISGHMFNISLAAVGTDLSLKETAKLFAVYAVAGYDAAIATWYQKYKYLYWRPITAFRQGDSTHKPQPGFTPLLNTPPHPEYPSGHSTTGGAYASVVAKFLNRFPSSKTDQPFLVPTESNSLPPRTYETIDGPALDIVISRVYAGVHFSKSSDDGYKIGLEVGNLVYKRFEEVFGAL